MLGIEFSNEELERRAENFVRALHPRLLLVNVCGPIFSQPSIQEFRIGLGGGYTNGYGQSHPEAHAWPVLQAFLENDARVQNALREAECLGLRGRFGGDQWNSVHVFEYIFDVDDHACALIRQRAFQNKDHFPGDEAAWEQRFDLYLQQSWTEDHIQREYYRTHFELVDWPQTPRELWPI